MCDIHEEDAVFRAINRGLNRRMRLNFYTDLYIQPRVVLSLQVCSYARKEREKCSHCHTEKGSLSAIKTEGDENVLYKETIRMSMDKFT